MPFADGVDGGSEPSPRIGLKGKQKQVFRHFDGRNLLCILKGEFRVKRCLKQRRHFAETRMCDETRKREVDDAAVF